MFHRFPIGKYSITQHIPSFGRCYKNVGGLWRVSDCEELVGVTHKKDTFTKDTILIKLNFEKQYFAVKLFI